MELALARVHRPPSASPGQKEERWAQVLGGGGEVEGASPSIEAQAREQDSTEPTTTEGGSTDDRLNRIERELESLRLLSLIAQRMLLQ